MKEINIKYCDGLKPEDDLVFLPLLKKHYKVTFSDHPDYLFYSCFGTEHLRYDCVKIFTTGECVTPNFNECDYATGFDYLNLQDRYLRLPLSHIMYRNGVNMMDIALKRNADEIVNEKREFCSFVVSNGNGMPERKEFFEKLSKYKKVDSGGKFLNNIGGPVENKLEFDKKHKFSICFENECYPGYTTEKLTEAFAAGCIPIYYGDPLAGNIFNKKAFINVGDFETLDSAAEAVKKIDNDESLYYQMLREAILTNNEDYLSELEKFLCHIFNQNLSAARRRPKSQFSKRIERNSNFADFVYFKMKKAKI